MLHKRVLITGASGLIGSRLTNILLSSGYLVSHLSRSKGHQVETYTWDVDRQIIEPNALKNIDAIIHLAGANVADKRWTTSRKQELYDSRIKSTQLLFTELSKGNHQVKTFISASAIGYYGFDDAKAVFNEDSPAGNDFLASLTKDWESEVDKIATLGIRTCKLRIGIVLAKNGGALEPVAKTVRNLIGAPLGSGEQFMSWIHLEDICRMFVHLLESENLKGPYNGVAPKPVSNKKFTQEVAEHLHKPLILPNVPAFALRLAFGEMGDIVLKGSKVSNQKIVNSGFQYQYPDLEKAIANLLDE